MSDTSDLRGNTNFVVLKDINDAIVVPRTNLAAVDMTVANGLAITGNTLYTSLATAEDVETGTIGSLVDAAVLKSVLDDKQSELTAGTGINITSNVINVDLAAGERMEIISGNTIGQKRYFPITNITGNTVTLAAGSAFVLNATNGTKTLYAENMDDDVFGLEGHIEIFVANTGSIQTGKLAGGTTEVVLADALEPNSVNNCTVRFHDHKAIISVEDHVAGHVVTVSAGTVENSLYYWMTQPNTASDAASQYIAFDGSLNGTPINFEGASNTAVKHLVGNGYTQTLLTGDVAPAAALTVSDLGLQNVNVTAGTFTLGDAYIPSGSTVSVSGGGLAVEKVTGAGESSVIDLGQTSVRITQNQTAMLSGVMITGQTRGIGVGTTASGVSPATLSMYGCTMYGLTVAGTGAGANGGAISMDNITGGQYNPSEATLVGCTISGNKAPGGGGIFAYRFSQLTLSGCSVTGNVTTGKLGAGILLNSSSFATIDNCVISGNSYSTSNGGHDIALNEGASALITGGTIGEVILGSGGTATFGGTVVLDNVIPTSNTVSGNVVISSGASINLTGAINPGGTGGIQVVGGTCTVNGVPIDPNTYTSIVSSGGSAVITQ